MNLSGCTVETGALVLVYHRVADVESDPWELAVSPRHFKEQMHVLRRDCTVVRVPDVLARLAVVRSKPLVGITLDDGYADNLLHAAPLLAQHGLPATVFVCTGPVSRQAEFWWDALERLVLWPCHLPVAVAMDIDGQRFEFTLGDAAIYTAEAHRSHRSWRAWDPPPTRRHELFVALWEWLHRLHPGARQAALRRIEAWADPPPAARPPHRALGPQELIELSRTPGVEIGAHSVSHSALSALATSDQISEIAGSREWLETVLDGPITGFAYPFGRTIDYTSATVAAVQDAGFEYACANIPGIVQTPAQRFELPRVQVNDWGGDEFARRLRTWLGGVFEDAEA